MPLEELWDDNGSVAAERLRDLSATQVRELLKADPVRFVVVDVGAALEWVAEARCFAYWKDQVSGHLADPGQPVSLDAFPGGYCYLASEWSLAGSKPIVVLERRH